MFYNASFPQYHPSFILVIILCYFWVVSHWITLYEMRVRHLRLSADRQKTNKLKLKKLTNKNRHVLDAPGCQVRFHSQPDWNRYLYVVFYLHILQLHSIGLSFVWHSVYHVVQMWIYLKLLLVTAIWRLSNENVWQKLGSRLTPACLISAMHMHSIRPTCICMALQRMEKRIW